MLYGHVGALQKGQVIPCLGAGPRELSSLPGITSHEGGRARSEPGSSHPSPGWGQESLLHDILPPSFDQHACKRRYTPTNVRDFSWAIADIQAAQCADQESRPGSETPTQKLRTLLLSPCWVNNLHLFSRSPFPQTEDTITAPVTRQGLGRGQAIINSSRECRGFRIVGTSLPGSVRVSAWA